MRSARLFYILSLFFTDLKLQSEEVLQYQVHFRDNASRAVGAHVFLPDGGRGNAG